jgi:7-cyano-7-deazaguanine reductase
MYTMSPQSNQYTTHYTIESPDIISMNMIDPIDYQYHDKRDVDIIIRQPEFTSVCPMTGMPDFGRITIQYIPDSKIVELKSLKYYLMQYRNVGIFYEHVVNRILDDLVAMLKPKSMKVTGDFTTRGGIDSTVSASYMA